MKNWSVIILTLIAFNLSFTTIEAQNSGNNNYTDTINVVIDHLPVSVSSHIFIGIVNAQDPEGQQLEYSIIQQSSDPYFTINSQYGHLYLNRKYIDELCNRGSYNLKLSVSDGQYWVLSSILIKFECN